MGKTLKEAMEILKCDSSRFYTINEPPGVLRGIGISLSDTCEIGLFVERTFINFNKLDSLVSPTTSNLFYEIIADKEIIALSWKKPKQNKSNRIERRDIQGSPAR